MKKLHILYVFLAAFLLSACASTSTVSDIDDISGHPGALYKPTQTITCRDIEIELNGFDIQDYLELTTTRNFAASEFSKTEYKVNFLMSETLPDNVIGLKITKIQLGIVAEFSEVELYLLLRPNGEIFSTETPFMVTQYGTLNATLLARASCNFIDGVNFEPVN